MQILDIPIKLDSKIILLKKIEKLENNQKFGLIAFYSEFFLRSLNNIDYKKCLKSKNNFYILDGHGAFWGLYTIYNPSIFVRFYSILKQRLFFFKLKIFFYLFLVLELIYNFFLGFWILTIIKPRTLLENKQKAAKYKKIKNFLDQNPIILGRELIYDLIKLAKKNNWKVTIIGGCKNQLEFKKNIEQKFNYNNFNYLLFSTDSFFMKDKTIFERNTQSYNFDINSLTLNNLIEYFPETIDIVNFLNIHKTDIILNCVGGKSGKQEILNQFLKEKQQINFKLIAGLGAALDHLGAGNKQKPSPLIFTNLGLEWLYRVIVVPNRRFRVIKTIIKFWYFISEQNLLKN